jgi:hypothetical protein
VPRKIDFNLSLIASENVPCSLRKFGLTASELSYNILQIIAKIDQNKKNKNKNSPYPPLCS